VWNKSAAFGGSAKSWLRQQMQYNLAPVQQKADSITEGWMPLLTPPIRRRNFLGTVTG